MELTKTERLHLWCDKQFTEKGLHSIWNSTDPAEPMCYVKKHYEDGSVVWILDEVLPEFKNPRLDADMDFLSAQGEKCYHALNGPPHHVPGPMGLPKFIEYQHDLHRFFTQKPAGKKQKFTLINGNVRDIRVIHLPKERKKTTCQLKLF